MKNNSWLRRFPAREKPAVRLFCFPYAGGAPSVFRAWSQQLPSVVEVNAISLPGREIRFGEPYATHIEQVAESLLSELKGLLDVPFAIFGHSMGALVGLDMAHRIKAAYAIEPSWFFPSGAPAPNIVATDRRNISDEALLQIVMTRWGALPEAIRNDVEMRTIVLETVRADLIMHATCTRSWSRPLNCPITVFTGTQDKAVEARAQEPWRDYTAGPFEMLTFEGDHLFISGLSAGEVIAAVGRRLCKASSAAHEGETALPLERGVECSTPQCPRPDPENAY